MSLVLSGRCRKLWGLDGPTSAPPLYAAAPTNFERARRFTFPIILVLALIITLLCSLFKIFHRLTNPSTPAPPDATQCRLREEFPSIPVLIYGEQPLSSASGHKLTLSFEAETCPICLADFERGEEVRVLDRCMHVYHKECIDLWLLRSEISSSCPICRDCIAMKKTVELATRNCEVDAPNFPLSLVHLQMALINV